MFKNLVKAFRGQIVPEPVLTPPGFRGAHVPVVDALEDTPSPDLVVTEDDRVARRPFVIVYTDAAGGKSERRIVALQVYSAEALVYLKARCLERQATRTFRVDRIREVFCGLTGEDLGSAKSVFQASEVRASKPKPDKSSMGINRCVQILVTVARADGRLHPNETDVISNFVDKVAPKTMTKSSRDSIRERGLRLAPSFTELQADFDDVLDWNRDLLPALLQGVIDVSESDGVFGPEEVALTAAMIERARERGVPVSVG